MIIDSSVAVAVCLGEPAAEELISVLERAQSLRMSAASIAEAGVSLSDSVEDRPVHMAAELPHPIRAQRAGRTTDTAPPWQMTCDGPR